MTRRVQTASTLSSTSRLLAPRVVIICFTSAVLHEKALPTSRDCASSRLLGRAPSTDLSSRVDYLHLLFLQALSGINYRPTDAYTKCLLLSERRQRFHSNKPSSSSSSPLWPKLYTNGARFNDGKDYHYLHESVRSVWTSVFEYSLVGRREFNCPTCLIEPNFCLSEGKVEFILIEMI